MSLRDYPDSCDSAVERLDDYGFSESIDINEEIRAAKQIVNKAKIVLVDGSVFQVREYIDAKYKIKKNQLCVPVPQ